MPEQLILLFQALGTILFHWENLGAVVFGTVAGIFLGAMPGLTSTVGIALLIPFSFYMSPLAAIAMMYGVNKGGIYGGSIPAILLHVPGTPAAACTQLDGYPLTQQGKHGKALQMAVYASAIGDTLSDIVLVLFTVKLASFAVKFGPPEFFTVILFALTIIGSVTGRSVIKGLFSAFAGLLLATVGLDPITSMPRFDFGITELSARLPLVPILIGIFSVSEVIIQAEKAVTKGKSVTIAPKSKNPADNRVSWLELRGCLKVIFRSYFWGQLIGILPGIGAAISCWVGYGEAKRTSKHPERFGKGALEGVAASEAANNAVCGANLVPLLTLGVPGSTDIAVLMGVFLIHGIDPGPRIFVEQPQLVYGIFAA
jgi:putative tricarboxylic transport membrane protein